MKRRTFLLGSAVAGALIAAPEPVRSPFGICIYSYGATRKFAGTLEFLDHCHDLGAAGIQMPLTSLDLAYAEKVRARAAEYGMYYEGIVGLLKNEPAQLEQQLIAAKAAGATVVRTACLGGRRYETFHDLAAWEQFVRDSHAAIERAIPILDRQKVAMAIENHKDWTVEEMQALMAKYQSEYLGLCIDFGNNISLLDSPDAVLKLAPYAISAHAKDIAVEPADDGFRMAEVPLGQGVVDVAGIVSAVRAAHPKTQFSFEMIVRDPLSIPCLTDPYWVTFPERSGLYLERTLKMVKTRANATPLTQVTPMPKEAQSELAEQDLRLCLDYARRNLAA